MNFDRLRFVAERAGLGENSEALISVVIPERPSRYYMITPASSTSILLSIRVQLQSSATDSATPRERIYSCHFQSQTGTLRLTACSSGYEKKEWSLWTHLTTRWQKHMRDTWSVVDAQSQTKDCSDSRFRNAQAHLRISSEASRTPAGTSRCSITATTAAMWQRLWSGSKSPHPPRPSLNASWVSWDTPMWKRRATLYIRTS